MNLGPALARGEVCANGGHLLIRQLARHSSHRIRPDAFPCPRMHVLQLTHQVAGGGATSPGTGPLPRRSAPWHIPHGLVLPAPMVTILTPFFTLPTGAYTMIPEWSSR